jgi:outer membrane protein OmpA-like peptidoglycan-associated protein
MIVRGLCFTATRGAIVAGVIALAQVVAPCTARAQAAERLSVGLEGGIGTLLSEAQSNDYGFGFHGSVRFGVRLGGPVGVHAFGGFWTWTSSRDQLESGSLTAFGGGLRIAPEVSPRVGGPLIELEAGYGLSGADAVGGLLLQGGLGWLFPAGRVLGVGPVARIGFLKGLDGNEDPNVTNSALFWSLGINLSFHAPRRTTSSPETSDAPPRSPNDPDGDGIPGDSDRCPNEPETWNGYRDDDGCHDAIPEGDPDNDHIEGTNDMCPNEAEDADHYRDEDGCPDPDNDNDGVPDATDRCPDRPGTRNGQPTADGCPEDTSNSPAALAGTRIQLAQVVTFDTGRPTLQSSSRATLDAVAQLLRDHPEVRRVRIEGHTDNSLNARRAQRLSLQRARQVLRYLQRAGVVKRRMVAQGLGATRPLVEGDTDDARARNNRIELVIIDPAEGVTATAGSAPPTNITPATNATAEPAQEGQGGRRGRRGRHGGRRRRR